MASLDPNPNPEDQPQPNPKLEESPQPILQLDPESNPNVEETTNRKIDEAPQTTLQIEPEVETEPTPKIEEEAANPRIEASITLTSLINEPQPTPIDQQTDTGLDKPTNLKTDEEPKPNPEIEPEVATIPQIELDASIPLPSQINEPQSGPIEQQTDTGLDKPTNLKTDEEPKPNPEIEPEVATNPQIEFEATTEASISLPSQINEPQSGPIEQQTNTGLDKPEQPNNKPQPESGEDPTATAFSSDNNNPKSPKTGPIEQQTDTGLAKSQQPNNQPESKSEEDPTASSSDNNNNNLKPGPIEQQTDTGLAKPEQPKPESGSISEEDPTASSSDNNNNNKSPKPEIELDDEPLAKKQKQSPSSLKEEEQPPEPMLVEETVTVITTTKSKSKSKKKNNNVWVTKTTRKGKKKTKANTPNSVAVEDKVLITPIPRFPDKSDDTPELEICLSKVYKAEKVEVSEDRLTATSSKGYRMVRATRGAIEGAWYYEIKVVSLGESGHTRLGWSNDKGDLQAPVGYDGNSFGFRDVDGCKVHNALREGYGEEGYKEGDVIGFYICLPDGETFAPKAPRYVWYKGQRYVCAPDDNEEPPKVVPGSEISFFKNGVCQGVAFTDILGGRYYPAASMYTLPDQSNCVVKFNFGPDFECFPEDFGGRATPKPMCEVPYHGYTGRLESNGSDDMKS